MSARGSLLPSPTVAIIGAGVIGLAIAWRLAQRGAKVSVFDKGTAGSGASHAAAGMLAAHLEAEPREENLVALNRVSQALWPAFAAELEAASGLAVDLRTEGTLLLALTGDDQSRLKHVLAFQKSLGLPLEWLSTAEVRRREPHLTPSISGAIFSPQDHQVDNRAVAAALREAALKAGVTLHENTPVERIVTSDNRVTGVGIAGQTVAADTVILAAGAWSRGIAGLPAASLPPVRPVKGQMLALRMDPQAPLLTHVVWAPGAYLVPRNDGRLLIGATVEEKGFDPNLTAGGQLALLEATWRALPGIEELPIHEMWVGFRPGSRDDAPIIGESSVPGLIYATGHYRNGILLTPVTAEAIAALVMDGKADPRLAKFGFERFAQPMAAE
jgi:glycine oxidase